MPIVAVPHLAMLDSPRLGAQQVNEGLWGESLQIVSEAENGYIECRLDHDGYRGFVLAKHVAGQDSPASSAGEQNQAAADATPESTLVVAARSTLLFSEPDIKSRVVCRLPLLSRIWSQHLPHGAAIDKEGKGSASSILQQRFVQTSKGYAVSQHLCSLQLLQPDKVQKDAKSMQPIDWAELLFPSAPYLWGGRTPDGCDCSGLVQSVVTLAGYCLPRDSSPQEQSISLEVEASERTRGDLVFWPGHVGILAQTDVLLHANAHSMDCRLEPLADVNSRAGEPSSIRRLQRSGCPMSQP